MNPKTVVFLFVPSDVWPPLSVNASPGPEPSVLPSPKPKASYVVEKLGLLAITLLIAFGVGVNFNAQPDTPSPANPPAYPAGANPMPRHQMRLGCGQPVDVKAFAQMLNDRTGLGLAIVMLLMLLRCPATH